MYTIHDEGDGENVISFVMAPMNSTNTAASERPNPMQQALAEVTQQVDALNSSLTTELEARTAWSQIMENRLGEACSIMHEKMVETVDEKIADKIKKHEQEQMHSVIQNGLLQVVSEKVAEEVKKSGEAQPPIPRDLMEALNQRLSEEAKKHEQTLAATRSDQDIMFASICGEQTAMQKEFKELKVSLALQKKTLDSLALQKKTLDQVCLTSQTPRANPSQMPAANLSQTPAATPFKIEDRVKRLQGKFSKDIEQLQAVQAKSQADLAELKDQLMSVNTDHVVWMKALDVRLQKDIAMIQERIDKEVSQCPSSTDDSPGGLRLDAHVQSLSARVDELVSDAVSHGTLQQIKEDLKNQCLTLRQDVENETRKALNLLRDEVSARGLGGIPPSQTLVEQLSLELEALKEAQGKSHKLSAELDGLKAAHAALRPELVDRLDRKIVGVEQRLSEIRAEIDGLSSSVREDSRLRLDLGDRLDRKVASVEHELRGEIQQSMDDVSHKCRNGINEMQEALVKRNSDVVTRRLAENYELIDERIQGLVQSSQQKTLRSVEEVRTSVERQISGCRDTLGQERATRESGEQRLNKRIDTVVEQLNSDHETLHKRCDKGLSTATQAIGTFSWEDEARRLWEAIDQHMHDDSSQLASKMSRLQLVARSPSSSPRNGRNHCGSLRAPVKSPVRHM